MASLTIPYIIINLKECPNRSRNKGDLAEKAKLDIVNEWVGEWVIESVTTI